MFHGGTNFALSNGAIWKNFTAAFTTSYGKVVADFAEVSNSY